MRGDRLFRASVGSRSPSVRHRARLAAALANRVLEGMAETREADITRAQGLIDQVLVASPRNPAAHFVRGQLLRREGRYDEAVTEYEAALASNRNSAVALLNLGRCKYLTGRWTRRSRL